MVGTDGTFRLVKFCQVSARSRQNLEEIFRERKTEPRRRNDAASESSATRVLAMFHGNDYPQGPVSDVPAARLLRIPVDSSWPAAPVMPETSLANEAFADAVTDTVVRSWREQRVRLQRTIDAVSVQVAVLDLHGDITAVNRAWRLSARMNGLANPKHVVGTNYLNVCRAQVAAGDRGAVLAAEGIESVLEGRRRSFFFKYACRTGDEKCIYAMLAWRIVEDGATYVAVSHELVEAHPST
jgi:hypothetical protein